MKVKRRRAPRRFLFVDAPMAACAHVGGDPTVRGYRLACVYFNTGLIDRSGVLPQGFAGVAADPIPEPGGARRPLDALCYERAEAIVAASRERNRPIRLFWSGGIDSTAAYAALRHVLGADTDRLEIVLNRRSIAEYKALWRGEIRALRTKWYGDVGKGLKPDAINVTGECGDQLFGSAKAFTLPTRHWHGPWNTLHTILCNIFNEERGTDAFQALAPVVAAAPVRIETLFDALWWINMAAKWNAVCYRMLASRPPSGWPKLEPTILHFYRTEAFQRWAMQNRSLTVGLTRRTYKQPLKTLIHAYTGDAVYRDTKLKVPSLRASVHRRKGLPLAIDERFRVHRDRYRPVDKADGSGGSTWSFGISIGMSGREARSENDDPRPERETDLWDDLDGRE